MNLDLRSTSNMAVSKSIALLSKHLHDRYGCRSVMIWAAIWYGGRSELRIADCTMTGRKYRDEIVVLYAVPTVHQQALMFQHDNTTSRHSVIVRQCLHQVEIPTLNWPARSPDLATIEHAWDMLGHQLQSSYSQPPATYSFERVLIAVAAYRSATA